MRRYLRLRPPPLPVSMSSGDGRAQQLFLLSVFLHHGRGRGLSGTLRRWARSFTSAFRDGAVVVFCPCWGWQLAETPEEEVEAEGEAEEVGFSELRRAFLASLFHRGARS